MVPSMVARAPLIIITGCADGAPATLSGKPSSRIAAAGANNAQIPPRNVTVAARRIGIWHALSCTDIAAAEAVSVGDGRGKSAGNCGWEYFFLLSINWSVSMALAHT